MDTRRRACPGKPQLADGAADASDTNNGQHGFGWGFAGFRVRGVTVDEFAQKWFASDGTEGTDTDTNESKTGQSQAPATNFVKDNGVRNEGKIQN